jgi:hypothetical protein
MKIKITLTRKFKKDLNKLLSSKKILLLDFDNFKEQLAKDPEKGDLIVGAGGIRKIRIKSASSGKSGGFRICYYYLVRDEEIFLILIYSKSSQENLTADQKRLLKEIANEIKKT